MKGMLWSSLFVFVKLQFEASLILLQFHDKNNELK